MPGSLAGRRRLTLESLESRRLLAVFHVSLGGNDADTGGAADPFRTIAVGIAAAAAADDGADEVRVEAGTYNTAAVDLPVAILTDAELDNLTLSGGWNAAFTLQTGTTTFTPQAAGNAITVTDDDVTISDITINGATGAGSDGIDASVSNSLTLVNVISTNHAGDGLHSSGVAAVSISNSTFSSNADEGIDVDTATTLSASNLTLALNADDGGVLAAIGTVNYTASAGATADSLQLSATEFERVAPAQQAIRYTGITTLNLSTGAGDDQIAISGTAAGTSTTIDLGSGDDDASIDNVALLGPVSLIGGSQTVEDTFDYNLAGAAVTLTATTITAAGSQSVTLAGFENQNFDGAAGAIPSITVNHSAAGGTTTLASGATADSGVITPAGGTAFSFFALAGSAPIAVNGSTGDDRLSFVNSGATLLSAAVTFAGGAQVAGDSLALSGSGNVVPTIGYTASGAGAGSISVSAGVLTIAYSGLEPIVDTMAATNLNFQSAAGADSVAYENGATLATTHQIRSTTGAFETLEFSNKTNVVVDLGAADVAATADTITAEFTQNATGLATLQFLTGNGDDTVNIRTTQAGVVTTVVDGAGTDTVNVSSNAPTNTGNLNGIAGALTVSGETVNISDAGGATANNNVIVTSSTVENFAGAADNVTITYGTVGALNLTGNANAEIFNVRSTAAGTATTINAGGGADTINVSSDAPVNAGNLNGIAGALTINGDAGATDTLNISDAGGATANSAVVVTATTVENFAGAADNVTITYGTIEAVNLTGNANAESFTVRSTTATTITTINAGAGSDFINVGNAAGSLDQIAGQVVVNGGANLAAPAASFSVSALGVTVSNSLPIGDILTINDSGDATANTYDFSANNLVRNGTTIVVYGPATTVETINFSAGTNTDTINVNATPASVNFIVNTTAGGDSVTVATTGATSNVIINGDAGVNAIAITTTGAGSVTIVNAGGSADVLTQDNSGAGSLVVWSGEAGDDSIRVRRSAALSITAINGGDGNDTIDLGNAANSLDEILGVVGIDGGANLATTTTACAGTDAATVVVIGDTVNVNDQGDASGNSYALAATTLARNGVVSIAYSGTETINLNSGSGADTVVLSGPPAANHVSVNTNSGVDSILVQATAAGSATEINAGAGNDFVQVGSAAGSLSTILGAICLDGGASDAAPTINFSVTVNGTTVSNSLPQGDTLLVNDQANAAGGTYSIDNNSLQRTPGSAVIAFLATETLSVNAGSGTDVINVATTANSQNVVLNTTGGGDSVNVSTTGLTSNLIVNGDAAANTVTLTTTGNGSVAIVNAAAGADVLTLEANGTGSLVVLNGEGDADAVNIRSTALASIAIGNGGAENDTFNIGNAASSLDGIAGVVFIEGQVNLAATITAAAGTPAAALVTIGDTVNINDQGDASGNLYTITATVIARVGTPNITYSGIETLNLNAGAGADNVTLIGASANHVVVNTGGAADAINIQATIAGSVTETFSGAGNDFVQISGAGSLDSILGNIFLNGDANDAAPVAAFSVTSDGVTAGNTLAIGDIAFIDDSADATSNTYDLTINSVRRNGGSFIAYATTETLSLSAGANTDTLNIAAAGGVNTTLNTTAGGDTVNVSSVAAAANLIINGDAGANAINVVPLGATGAGSVMIVNAGGAADSIGLGGVGAAALAVVNGEDGGDTVNLVTSAATSVTVANGGNGNDTINVGNGTTGLDNILGATGVFGGGQDLAPSRTLNSATFTRNAAPVQSTFSNSSSNVAIGDTLNLLDGVHATSAAYTIDAGHVNRNGGVSVAHSDIESLQLTAGSANDSFTLQTPSGGPALPGFVSLNAGGGVDDRLVINGTAGADAIVVGSDAANLAPIQVAGMDCALINASDGADTIVANRLTLPAQVQGSQEVAVVLTNAGAGDDNVLGSQSVDHITGGADNDLIFSQNGNDLVEGQGGNDEVHGGNANDIIFGGDGIDRLFGEDGDDFLFSDQNFDGSVAPAPSGIGGEVVDGGNGTNSAVALGADNIINITDLLFTDAGTLDVISWLKANFQTSATPVFEAAAAKFPVDC